MPGDYGRRPVDRASKRGKNRGSHPKQHAGHPVIRGAQLPTYKGKAVGPGTGRVPGIGSIGRLLPGGSAKGRGGSAKRGWTSIIDRRQRKHDLM